ncbi:MAG: amino acid-binding ACT domain-containing protein [Candidatus Hodarchaeota archaeon]
MRNLVINLEDYPGTLADMAEALGNAKINIEGICQISMEGKGLVHILVEEVSETRRVLEKAGIEVEEELKVLVIECKNQPGEVARITRKVANAGVNINLVYIASRNRMVLGVDNLDKAKNALKYDPLFFKEFIKSSH